MDEALQKVVGRNLAALMRHSAAYSSPKKLAARISASKSTVERIRSGAVACQIDTLASIAKAFDVEPWQLLVPGLDPANPPMLRHEDERLKALYASLRTAADRIAEYDRGGPKTPIKGD
jgi:transcriptional regulator with XRE-family HTH domain